MVIKHVLFALVVLIVSSLFVFASINSEDSISTSVVDNCNFRGTSVVDNCNFRGGCVGGSASGLGGGSTSGSGGLDIRVAQH